MDNVVYLYYVIHQFFGRYVKHCEEEEKKGDIFFVEGSAASDWLPLDHVISYVSGSVIKAFRLMTQ